MDGNRFPRPSLKTHRPPDWKEKLRQNCLRRVREERAHLIWKIRSYGKQIPEEKETIGSAFKDIVSDELKKIKGSSMIADQGIPSRRNDIWEYDGLDVDIHDNEELLIEMQRHLYDDLREEAIRRELEAYEEEDDYLAQAVFEHLQLNKEQNDKLWCPLCKKGELQDVGCLIYCTCCELRLDLEDDKANLGMVRYRLAEVCDKHLERGCKLAPNFCMETIFTLKALFIQCHGCETFEVVL